MTVVRVYNTIKIKIIQVKTRKMNDGQTNTRHSVLICCACVQLHAHMSCRFMKELQ